MTKSFNLLFALFFIHFSALSQIDFGAYRHRSDSLRKQTDSIFTSPGASPLDEKERVLFDSLSYFPWDSAWVIPAFFYATPQELPFKMKTTTDRLPAYVKHGELHFTIQDRKFKLSVYRNIELSLKPGYQHYLFLPFSDLSNGSETYGGGRYIDIRGPLDGEVVIDFNLAYNPYCAYNAKYSCPIPPAENHLSIPVLAGVKSYEHKTKREKRKK